MQAFTKLTGIAAILDKSDVDTDQIIPKQFLKKIERIGFGKHLFHDWRYLDDAGEKENPDFILNHPRYKGASILVAKDNFGCGSSREHAPWALLDYGFRSIIAPSFADIFYNNCFKNGILPIQLEVENVEKIFDQVEKSSGAKLTIDLREQKLTLPDGSTIQFKVDDFRKECLLNGWDDIGLSLRQEEKIKSFEKEYEERRKYNFSGLKKAK